MKCKADYDKLKMHIVSPRATNQIKIEKEVYSGNNMELLNNSISPREGRESKKGTQNMGK